MKTEGKRRNIIHFLTREICNKKTSTDEAIIHTIPKVDSYNGQDVKGDLMITTNVHAPLFYAHYHT